MIFFKGALTAKIVYFCYPLPLSCMIDALIKRVSVTYTCYEMYEHRGKKSATARVLRSSRIRLHLINYQQFLRSLPNRH
jgi:hypothetical protein